MKLNRLNKITFLLIFSIFFLAGLANETMAATRTVTKVADTDDGVCNADCSLREALGVAQNGDVINFEPNLNGGTIVLSSPLTIDKNMTINGLSDLTISGNDSQSIFQIEYGFVTMNNLNLTDGFNTDRNGGAISAHSSVITLNNCQIHRNKTNEEGGAIYVSNATLNLNNTWIAYNEAALGGGISGYRSTINIANSKLKSNSSSQGGGALYADDCYLFITDSSIYLNKATNEAFGGGLHLTRSYLADEQAKTVIKNSVIYNNSASSGGGIYNLALSPRGLYLINSTLSGNQATGVKGHGGGLVSDGDEVRIINSTIAFNTATGNGGGIFRTNPNGSFVNLVNSIVAANVNANGFSPDIKGSVVSTGYNLIGSTNGAVCFFQASDKTNLDPMLLPLAKNGGTTLNHLPKSGSPALGAGSNANAVDENLMPLARDQRGFDRISGGTVDIGAVERRRDEASVIYGTIFDPDGRVLISATAVLTNARTGEKRRISTDETGIFRFEEAAVGEGYLIEVEHERFAFEPQLIRVTENANIFSFRARG